MKGFVLSLLAVASLWACKGTEDPYEIGADECGLTISIQGKAAEMLTTKAAQTTNLSGDNRVNSATVYVYSSTTGKYITSKSVISTDFKEGVAEVKMGKIPTDKVDIVALANVDMTGKSVETLSDLKNQTITYNPSDFTSKGLPMSAIAKGQTLIKGESANRVILDLEKVVAKVNVSWEVNYDNAINVASYKLLRCYLLNGRNTTTLVADPESDLAVEGLCYGYSGVKIPEQDPVTEPTKYFLKGELTYNNKFDFFPNISGSSVSFFLFENHLNLGDLENRTFKGTKIVLEYEVEYHSGGTNVTTYIAAINAKMDNSSFTESNTENGKFVKRNNIYNVNYVINAMGGNPSDEEPTPWEPVLARDLIVELHVLDWDNTINQTITF